MLNLEKQEINVILSALQVLNRKDEVLIEKKYKLSLNHLYNKLYTYQEQIMT